MASRNEHIIQQLQNDILRLQGFKPAGQTNVETGLGSILKSFPNQVFPVGCIHEFVAAQKEDRSATSGFISGLLSYLMADHGITAWVSTGRQLFPPALKNFGISPDRFIFIDLKKEQDALWAIEEALKCSALTAVVGELKEFDFITSRRLQLAVENSKVTGFLIKRHDRHTTACMSKWKISSEPSTTEGEQLPGVGYPKWKIELLRVKNGKPGSWLMRWCDGKFEVIERDRHRRHSEGDDYKQAG